MDRSSYGIIKQIIFEETIFLRHYVGEVIDNKDELSKGRIQVAIYDLNWTTKNNAPWCNPRYIGNGIGIPKIGDWVEIYFINADRNRPVWLGISAEVKDNFLSNFVDHNTDVIHENRETDDAIIYNKNEEQYIICDGSESFVKGDTLKPEVEKDAAALQQLKTDITAWTPVQGDGGLALKVLLTAGFLTKTLGSYTNILSDKIKGQ